MAQTIATLTEFVQGPCQVHAVYIFVFVCHTCVCVRGCVRVRDLACFIVHPCIYMRVHICFCESTRDCVDVGVCIFIISVFLPALICMCMLSCVAFVCLCAFARLLVCTYANNRSPQTWLHMRSMSSHN